jgi:hypothetical protein
VGTYTADEMELIESCSAGQVMAAISEAIKLNEMETVVELLAILSRKDPHAADLIVRAVQYQGA